MELLLVLGACYLLEDRWIAPEDPTDDEKPARIYPLLTRRLEGSTDRLQKYRTLTLVWLIRSVERTLSMIRPWSKGYYFTFRYHTPSEVSIGLLKDLNFLDMEGNSLEGRILEEFFNLSDLTSIYLVDNQRMGSVNSFSCELHFSVSMNVDCMNVPCACCGGRNCELSAS